ncbi:MAG: hypothetical protein KGQ60_11190 [Planctomycetes bacterium]|nr:hypothetical protein [Planctomycetota bacterium]
MSSKSDSMRPCSMLVTLWIQGFLISAACAQVERSSPSLDDALDTSTISEDERPRQLELNLPERLQQVVVPVSADERQEMSAWVKWLVLKNLPANYEDNRRWNQRKEVVVGLHIHRDGFRIQTKRKTKSVKHGTWTRYLIEFIDPEKELQIDIEKIEFLSQGRIDISTRIELPLRLFGRVSQWQRDFQWYSLSADGSARVELHVDCQVNVRVNPTTFPPDVEFAPVVTEAEVQLKEFEIERISRLGGDAAELLGKGIREILDEKLEEYDDKLVEKMNQEIGKQKSKLTISLGDWLEKKLSKRNETE